MISKVRKYVSKSTLLKLYHTLIYPYLTYCSHVWGLSCKSYMNALVKLQKRTVKIIPGVHPRTHTDSLFIVHQPKIAKSVMKSTSFWLIALCIEYILMTPCLQKMSKYMIMTHVRRTIIICLVLKQDLVKPICGKIMLYARILYWSVVSQLMPVKQFSPKHWNVLSSKTNYKESYHWKIPVSLISRFTFVIIHRTDSEQLWIHIITALYSERNMMTSSNGNIFRVTGPLCGEFTGLRWIPRTKVSDAELWCFLWSVPE